MAKPIVVVADPINIAGVKRLEADCEVRVLEGKQTSTSQEAALRDAAGVIIRVLKVTPELLDACPKLQIVAKHGAGVDNIDIPASTQRGVIVTNTGGANSPAVAETAVMLMLAALRRVPVVHSYVTSNQFDKRWELMFHDLWKRTVGIVGCGNIGRTVAKICSGGFGCKILGYDPMVDRATMAAAGIEKVDNLHELLGKADLVSLHTPFLPSTHHMIDRAALKAMQKHAILVNTSRGEVLDSQALADALADGTISGAGIDAFENEPPLPNDPLLTAKNIVLSPHVAGATWASRERSAVEAAEEILAVLAGQRPKNLLNPEVWDKRRKAG